MKKLWVYMKDDDDRDKIERLLNNILSEINLGYEVYNDKYKDFVYYNKMKNEIQKNEGIVILSSVDAIAHNKKNVLKELLWYKECNNIQVIFADYPSTYIFTDVEASKLALNVIIDVYTRLQDNKTFDIRSKIAEKKTVGRKKINYPTNWDELYRQWDNDEITAKKFMDETGLKRGTFYHLANAYREQIKNSKEISKDA